MTVRCSASGRPRRACPGSCQPPSRRSPRTRTRSRSPGRAAASPRSSGWRAPSRSSCRGRPRRWPRARRRGCGSACGAAARRRAGASPRRSRRGCSQPADWTAQLRQPRELGGLDAPAPAARRELDVPGDVGERAALRHRARRLRGRARTARRVGDHVLAPGWTAYAHRLRYQTYDVTDLLPRGRATSSSVLLGNGWFRGRLGFGAAARALRRPAGAARPAGGRRTADGQVARARHRRVVDRARERDPRRRPLRRPARPICACAAGRGAADGAGGGRSTRDLGRLVAPDGPTGAGARRCCRPCEVITLAVGRDARRLRPEPRRLGAAARARRPGRRRRSPSATPRCSSTASSASGRCARRRRPTPTCSAGGGEEVLEPALHLPRLPLRRGRPAPGELRGRGRRGGRRRLRPAPHRLVRLAPTRLLNRFHENVVWGMRGNFVDVPTDCPQRDERLGWTGDIQVFAPDRELPLRHAPASCARGWPTWPPSSEPDGSVPVRRPRRAAARRNRPPPAGATPPTIVPWVLYERTGDAGAARAPARRACAPGSTRSPRWPARTGSVDRRIPVRRLARPDGAAGRARRGAGRPAMSSPRPTSPARRDLVAEAAERARATRRRRTLRARWPSEVRGAFAREYVTAGGRVLSDAADRVRAGARAGRCCRRASSATAPVRGWPTSCAPAASGSAPASSARR